MFFPCYIVLKPWKFQTSSRGSKNLFHIHSYGGFLFIPMEVHVSNFMKEVQKVIPIGNNGKVAETGAWPFEIKTMWNVHFWAVGDKVPLRIVHAASKFLLKKHFDLIIRFWPFRVPFWNMPEGAVAWRRPASTCVWSCGRLASPCQTKSSSA